MIIAFVNTVAVVVIHARIAILTMMIYDDDPLVRARKKPVTILITARTALNPECYTSNLRPQSGLKPEVLNPNRKKAKAVWPPRREAAPREPP